MKTKILILLIVPFLFITKQSFSISVTCDGRVLNHESVNYGKCHYTVWDDNGSTALFSGFGNCPSIMGNEYIVDFSANNKFAKALIKGGYKKADLNKIVIRNYDPNLAFAEKSRKKE